MIGPCFGEIGKTGLGEVLLEDLKGDFEDEDEIQISFMQGTKVRFTSYYYYTEDGAWGVDKDGWYEDENTYIGDTVSLKQGQAAWLISKGSSTQSGEVNGNEIVLNNFSKSWEMVVNPYPVAFNPNSSDIVWDGVQDEDEIQVSYMQGTKVRFNSYYYYTEDGAWGVDQDAWYIDENTMVEDPIAAAGQGWWLITANPSDVSITFKSPVKK